MQSIYTLQLVNIMANISNFKKSLKSIKKAFFDTGRKAFSDRFILEIFEKNKEEWKLPLSMNIEKFKIALVQQAGFRKLDLRFKNEEEKSIHYYDSPSVYDIALATHDKAYLSHYSAISVLNLTEQIPKRIYITIEQSKKPLRVDVKLVQNAVDSAFQKPQRISSYEVNYTDYTIIILRGKNTNDLGVKPIGNFRCTNIERTLIDAVVRPNYSGGINEVLKAFINAGTEHTVSVNKILMYLSKMGYVYPYHQAIGFYMERAGVFKETQISLLKSLDQPIKFYLTYGMKDVSFSSDWNLFFPKGF